MAKFFHPFLVALSLFVAVIVSNAALSLLDRVSMRRGGNQNLWLIGGGLAMGAESGRYTFSACRRCRC